MPDKGRDSVGLRGLYIPTLAAALYGAASLLFVTTVIGEKPLLHVGASGFFGAVLMWFVDRSIWMRQLALPGAVAGALYLCAKGEIREAFYAAGLVSVTMIVLGLVEARATTGRLSDFWRALVLQPSNWANRGDRPPP